MKLIRVNYLITVVILVCISWPVDAAEPRRAASDDKPVAKRPRIVQVANQETSLPAPLVEPTPINELSTDASDPSSTIAPARTWTLAELESVANTSHPMLQRDFSRIEAARGDALQAGLYPNPHFDTNNPQVFAGQNSLLNAGIMQEFVVKGKLRLDRAAATKVVQQHEFAYVQDRFSLLTSLRQQFYVVLAAQRRVTVLTELEKITSSSLETGRLLDKPAGEVARIDVLVLEIDNQKVQSDLENAIRILRGARKQLAVIVGDQSIGFDSFQGSIYDAPPQYDEEILKRFASADSAYVQIAKLEIERNELLLKRAIVEPYPNITLGPAYQWGLQNGSEQFWLTVTFPIPTWNRNQGNILSQSGDLAASRQDLEAIKLEQLRRVADSYSRHLGARASATKYETQIIPNVMKTLKLAKQGWKAGEYDFARFLQVQRTGVEALMDYIDLLEKVWTTAAELSGYLQLESFQ